MQINLEKDFYTIGEVEEITGLSKRIIHLNEERGLIESFRKNKKGNRYFDKHNVDRLNKIKQLQMIGLSFEEISEVIDLYFDINDYGVSGKKMALSLLQKQLFDIETKQQELQALKDDIVSSIAKLELLLQQSEAKLAES